MQRVEPNTAPTCFKNWIGKQMIKVNSHGNDKYEVNFQPVCSIEAISYKSRKYQVKKVMDDELHTGLNYLIQKRLIEQVNTNSGRMVANQK